MNKIYVDFKIPKKPETFIRKLFSVKTDYGSTINFMSRATYHDIECTGVQCKEGKYRTMDDLSAMFNVYYPEIDDLELFKLLIDTKVKGKTDAGKKLLGNLNVYNCSNVENMTMYYFWSQYADGTSMDSLSEIIDKSEYDEDIECNCDYNWEDEDWDVCHDDDCATVSATFVNNKMEDLGLTSMDLHEMKEERQKIEDDKDNKHKKREVSNLV